MEEEATTFSHTIQQLRPAGRAREERDQVYSADVGRKMTHQST